jgi:acyl-coenzyme A thioesterase PaaI-like protein
VVKFGAQFATCEAQVFDAENRLIASGRGTYFTAPLK